MGVNIMIKHFATIDFETYYDKEYSLSKMQTDEYVLDYRFEIIGVGVKVSGEVAQWFSGTLDEVRDFLQNAFDWTKVPVCFHNAHFDGFICTQRLNLKPCLVTDTVALARMHYPWWKRYALKAVAENLHLGAKGTEVATFIGYTREDFTPSELERYGNYCKNDVSLTHMIAELLLEITPLVEVMMIDMTTRMFIEPQLKGDTARLIAYHEKVLRDKEDLLEKAVADKEQLMSNEKFAERLMDSGIDPPRKISKRTGKENWAFAKSDKEFTALLECGIPEVETLVAARLGVKSTISETRALRLIHASQRGLLPVHLNHWGAKTTGRLSGGNKMNWQNIPARGDGAEIRQCIIAPPGYKIVVGDSSNIELRVAMVCAGETNAVRMLRNNEDLYCDFASKMYGRKITKDNKTERNLGKVAMLSLQYGSGAKTFRQMVRTMAKMDISQEEAERIVQLYRYVHTNIVKLWRYCEDGTLNDIHNGNPLQPVDVNGWVLTTKKGYAIPGLPGVCYNKLHRGQDGGWQYDMGGKPVHIYGGKVVENLCIAEGTQVLTDAGWLPIEAVTTYHKVFDGVEFVNHGGLLFKGVKQCVNIDSVYMTQDHEVYTYDGWQEASQLQRPDGSEIRYVNSDRYFSQYWKELGLELPLRLRAGSEEVREGRNKGTEAWWNPKLRVRNKAATGETENTRYESPPCLRRMALYVRQMQVTVTSSLARLWRAWDSGMRAMACVRELLGRHEGWIPAGANIGQSRQQSRILERELPLDYTLGAEHKQKEQFASEHSSGTQTDRCTKVNTRVQMAQKNVYDITNAGQRQRFVVAGASGAFLVHNCQHVARHIVMWQTLRVHRKYPVALSVHDEMVCVVPESEAEACKAFMEESLSIAPKWCAGQIPLLGEVAIGDSYGDAKG